MVKRLTGFSLIPLVCTQFAPGQNFALRTLVCFGMRPCSTCRPVSLVRAAFGGAGLPRLAGAFGRKKNILSHNRLGHFGHPVVGLLADALHCRAGEKSTGKRAHPNAARSSTMPASLDVGIN